MNRQQPFTIRNPLSRFQISGNLFLFNQIVRDMLENGGKLSPSTHWNWNLGRDSTSQEREEVGYTDDLYEENYSSLEKMLKPWVGETGMKPITEEAVSKYESFLRSIDHLGMLPANILDYGQPNDWRETDLGSIMDINLISAYFAEHYTNRQLNVCEVGGGYGRLAEALVGVLSQSFHYVLVDAVPGSLMYAYLYLRHQFPELKIGSYYQGDRYSDEYDFYVIPAWQIQQLHSRHFDICINIESMQEMEQQHVNHYFILFERLTIDNGLIYLSNARDYVFKGKWPIPAHWESLFLSNTPRSWTADHPTHILRKSSGNYSLQRSVLEGVFSQQKETWHGCRGKNDINKPEMPPTDTINTTSTISPAWSSPSKNGDGVIDFTHINPKVQKIEKSQNIQDLISRLKNTWLGKLYTNHLKQYTFIRSINIWLWHKLLPVYINIRANLAIHLLNRNAMRWRVLIKQSEYVQKRAISITKVFDTTLIETPIPKVYPEKDQCYLTPAHENYQFPEIFIAEISNGVVYGGTNLILAEDEVICHDLYDFKHDYTSEELHGRTLINPNTKCIRWLLHDQTPDRIPLAASFVDACASNYAHWLTEVLPRIAVLCAEQKFKHIPIVVNDELHKNIIESLLLVAGQEREIIILPIGNALHIDTLYLTSATGYVPFERRNNKLSGHSHGLFSPQAFELIRSTITSFAEKLPEPAWPKKIYLRRNSGIRQIKNAAEIEQYILDKGYTLIEPEKLTFLQQVQLFRHANEIIAPTGAALSNAIFCKPGTRVGVLMGKHKNMIYRYWLNMLEPLHINVSYVLGDIVENHDIGIHADSYLDKRDIFELLQSWQPK